MCSTKSWPTGCKLNSGARPPGTHSSVLDWRWQVPGGRGGTGTLARHRWGAAGTAAGRQPGCFLRLNAHGPRDPAVLLREFAQRSRDTGSHACAARSAWAQTRGPSTPVSRWMDVEARPSVQGHWGSRPHGGVSQPLWSTNSQAQVIWFH